MLRPRMRHSMEQAKWPHGTRLNGRWHELNGHATPPPTTTPNVQTNERMGGTNPPHRSGELCLGSLDRRTNGSGVRLRLRRSLRLRLGRCDVLRKVLATIVRNVRRDDPGRILRLGLASMLRTQVRPQHLWIDTQFERERFRYVRFRHDTTPFRSRTSYVRGVAVPERWRTAIDNIRNVAHTTRTAYERMYKIWLRFFVCPYAYHANERIIRSNAHERAHERAANTMPALNPPPYPRPACAVAHRTLQGHVSGASWPVISVLPKKNATYGVNYAMEE